MAWTRHAWQIGGVAFLGLAAAGALPADAGCAPPSWWEDPSPGTTELVYERGSAAKCWTEQEAWQQAYDAGVATLRKRITSDTNLWPQLHLAETDVPFDKTCPDALGRWHAWVLVSYPRDRFDSLLNHIQEGGRQYGQAVNLLDQKNYPEALAHAMQLIADYPVGKQVFFQTERALLLASDCYVGLGQPHKALQMCDSLLAGTEDPAFRLEAQNHQTAIRQDYTNILYRGIFNGRTFLVRGVTDLNGKAGSWVPMQKELENLVRQFGGRVMESVLPTASGLIEQIGDPGRYAAILDSVPADGYLVATAQGEMKHSTITKGASSLERYDFNGTVRVVLKVGGRVLHTWDHSGPIWFPGSADACMDALARMNVLPRWQADLAAQVEP